MRRVVDLDRVQVAHPVVAAQHVQQVVHHDRRRVAPARGHVGDARPLVRARVVALDALANVGAVVAPDGVEAVIHDGHGGPAASLVHRLDQGPTVERGVVALHGAQALTTDAVIPTHRVDARVEHNHAHAGASRRHGRHAGPLTRLCSFRSGHF